MKRAAIVMAALLTTMPAVAQQATASFGAYQPAPLYPETVSTTEYVRLRDGVRLAVRIDRPAVEGKPVEGRFPVIWHHSLSISQLAADGAGGRVTGFRQMPELTRHGYVVVQVARRGNGQSLGAMRGYHDRNEAQDAFEMTEWLADQPWSDGKVGMYGCSNTGDAAMHALTVRPPSLKAVFAGCFSWHKYDAFRRGGIYAQWGTGPARTVAQDLALDPVAGDEDKMLLAIAAQEHQNSTPLLEMWKQLPNRDSWSSLVGSRFWSEGSVASYAEAIRLSGVPVYIQGGWFDELRDQGFAAQLNISGSRMVIGPWKHCNSDDFGLLQEMHRFFDLNLKGIDTGLGTQAPIHYYTMHAPQGSAWRSTDRWPVADAEARLLHFASAGLSNRAARRWERAFDADFSVACPDAGSGSQVQPCHVDGAGLSFATAPVTAATEVTGDPLVKLWVSLNGPDANIFAYLEDVAPDGTVTVVTEGRQKASLRALHDAPWALPADVPWHRSYAEDRQPVTPGQAVELTFAMMPTSYVFRPGHRLQVTVTGADHRERIRDPEQPPRITLLGGRGHDSSISLPVVR